MSLIEVITSVRMPNPAWRVMADLTTPGKDPGELSEGRARQAMDLLRTKIGEAGPLLSDLDVTLALIHPEQAVRLRRPYVVGLLRRLGMRQLMAALRALLPVVIEQRLTDSALRRAIRRPRMPLERIIAAARQTRRAGGAGSNRWHRPHRGRTASGNPGPSQQASRLTTRSASEGQGSTPVAA